MANHTGNIPIFDKMNFARSIFIITFLIVLYSCKEAADVYLGVPLQPKLENNNFEPGLNIFGVIRPDFNDSISNTFVHVQEVAPAINNYPEFAVDSMIVKDAVVYLSNQYEHNFQLSYTTYDSLFPESQYRPASSFAPKGGDEFKISCFKEGLPELLSKTILPFEPKMLANSLIVQNSFVEFEIEHDTTAFLYEVYIFTSDNLIGYARVMPQVDENTRIEIILTAQLPEKILIYAFDYNLSDYYASSNISLNFNKYRKSFGNVEGGYGVFGSLNFVTVDF